MVRFLVTVLVLVLIVLVTGFFAAKTEGARRMVEDRLTKLLGVPVRVEQIRIGFPYALVSDRAASKGFEEGEPGFRAQEVRVCAGIRPFCRVSILRAELRLVRNRDGMWEPTALAGLGEAVTGNVAGISGLTESLRRRVLLRVRDSSIRWRDTGGAEVAMASGVDFKMAPVRFPGRRVLFHYDLSVRNWADSDGRKLHDLEREWLAWEKTDYLEMVRAGRPAREANKGFWEVSVP